MRGDQNNPKLHPAMPFSTLDNSGKTLKGENEILRNLIDLKPVENLKTNLMR